MKKWLEPWLVWLSGLSAGLWTKGSLVQFPVRAHVWLWTRPLVEGGIWEAANWCFSPSLSLSLNLSLKINKLLKKWLEGGWKLPEAVSFPWVCSTENCRSKRQIQGTVEGTADSALHLSTFYLKGISWCVMPWTLSGRPGRPSVPLLHVKEKKKCK